MFETILFIFYKEKIERSLLICSRCMGRKRRRPRVVMYWMRLWWICMDIDHPIRAIKTRRMLKQLRKLGYVRKEENDASKEG
ncbi:hypothetical protein LCGC14_1459190 [marine sediment metagenome]|uniref:Uncharacterized protein n=1 Tax=marine sediment metagenome TaxID=412755 RepID=A0A0F9JFJ3_9ZZZZ